MKNIKVGIIMPSEIANKIVDHIFSDEKAKGSRLCTKFRV